jgi:two-component system C4-dicarboxylate transport response regulator DctD
MTSFVTKQAVIFVEDDDDLRTASIQTLELAGLDVIAFSSAAPALKAITPAFTGVVVTDVRMPGMDGLQLFARIREIDPEIPVILMTGHADVSTAITALRGGAADFLTKPFANDHLIGSIERALNTRRLVIDNRMLRAPGDSGDSPLIGETPVMERLREQIAQLAKAEIDVLVEGETGTGKELVALLLHRLSSRRSRAFIAVNSGSLTEAVAEADLLGQAASVLGHGRTDRIGRIEASDRGTLFLDEIDSMPPLLQTAMLRVLEEREVLPIGAREPKSLDLRVIAATKKNLKTLAAQGQFREDLLYRLEVVRLQIPPLRERRDDIPLLFAHFAQEATHKLRAPHFRMTDAMRRRLIDHDWPGNVRELRNFAFAAAAGVPMASSDVAGGDRLTLAQRVERFEAVLIREALQATAGDIRTTMDALGIPRKTLYDKLSRHDIDPDDYRSRAGGAG